MKIRLLDTFTGETCYPDSKWSDWDWAYGNGSCDCNRRYFFSNFEEKKGCLCERYLITESDSTLFTLTELNDEYPEELLRKFGIMPE